MYPLANTWKKLGDKTWVMCPVCYEPHYLNNKEHATDGNGTLHACMACHQVFIEFVSMPPYEGQFEGGD